MGFCGPNYDWNGRTLDRNIENYMDNFMGNVGTMNWSGGGNLDPFSSDFMNGMVFGHSFPELRLGDFFAESDNFHPSNLGINLQDFGLNFASNFQHRNLGDLTQLINLSNPVSHGKPPASKEVVSKLPVFKLEKKHCKPKPDGTNEQPNCPICCSDIQLGEKAQLLPCGHIFHPDCTKPWLTQHNTCPDRKSVV